MRSWLAGADPQPEPGLDYREAWSFTLPPGQVAYAIGDIHGRLDLLKDLEGKILDDIRVRRKSNPDLAPQVIYLGDYVDRGPDSRGVVDHLIDNPLEGVETIHLMGNHEEAFLAFFDAPEEARGWLGQGGAETLLSYGIAPFSQDDPAARPSPGLGLASGSGLGWLSRARDQAVDKVPDRQRAFLAGLKLMHQAGDYIFAHAGIRPGVAPERQKAEDLLWIREPFLSHGWDFQGRCVVHGHTIVPEPEIRAGRIGVDTGGYRTGCLTAVVLQDKDVAFLKTGGSA
ncbi:MAG: metallophosphoesterase family protein [Rhodospirillaceae bacterium]